MYNAKGEARGIGRLAKYKSPCGIKLHSRENRLRRGEEDKQVKRLLKPRDKLTLIWFAVAVFVLYRYAWERPLAVAGFAAIAGGGIYAVILIALNKKKSPAALAGCKAHK